MSLYLELEDLAVLYEYSPRSRYGKTTDFYI